MRRFCSATSSSFPKRWGSLTVSVKPAAWSWILPCAPGPISSAFSVEHVTERLSYLDQALRLLRKELGDQTALIGFSGSPWTLATFMMEGGSAEKYTRALKLFHEDRQTFCKLAEKLTAAITAYLQMQINAGADALQIFDSHGGQLAPMDFQEASGRWMRDIVAGIGARAPPRLVPPRQNLTPGR